MWGITWNTHFAAVVIKVYHKFVTILEEHWMSKSNAAHLVLCEIWHFTHTRIAASFHLERDLGP